VCQLRRVRAANFGQRLLQDADQKLTPGGAAEALQVCGMQSLAGQALPFVQLRCAEQLLPQTRVRSARGWLQGLQGLGRVAVRTWEENATCKCLERAAGSGPSHDNTRECRAAGALDSQMSTAERPV